MFLLRLLAFALLIGLWLPGSALADLAEDLQGLREDSYDAKGKAVKKDVVWTIERVSKSQGGKRLPVTTDQTAAPNLLLGEGKYVVVAKAGDLIGETPFDIEADREKKVTVKLKPVSTADSGG